MTIDFEYINFIEQAMLFTDLQASLIVTFYIIFSLKRKRKKNYWHPYYLLRQQKYGIKAQD